MRLAEKTVYTIGVYPPPYGGVSSHIERLHRYLLDRGYNSRVVDVSGFPKHVPGVASSRIRGLVRLLLERPAIVHFHIDSPAALVAMCALSLRHAVLFSWHNERFMREVNQLSFPERYLYLAVFRRLASIIVCSEDCGKYARGTLGLSRVAVVPEYIPITEVPEDEVEQWAEYRRRFDVVLSSNAFQISFHEEQDLYGIDLLVELMKAIGNARNACMLFLLPGSGHEDYYARLQARIASYRIAERFVFIRKPVKEACALWKASDIVIRSTNTDGNSLTVWEALSMGTPVIASDCVARPGGAILFRNRDIADLVRAVTETLDNLEQCKQTVGSLKIENNATRLEELYRKLMEDGQCS